MKAEEFAAVLRGLTIPGAKVGPVMNDSGEAAGPGSGLEYGFTVTGEHGGRMTWQVALQKDGAQAREGSVNWPAPVPAQPDKLVALDVETSIAAWIGQSDAAEHVTEVLRYSEGGSVSAIRYGLRLTLDEGGRVFVQLLWTLRPGEQFERGNKFRLFDAV